MDRQGHDYSANSAMAYAQQQRQPPNMQQQQQQFGFPPQHQQFPSPLHNPPFLPGHLQQFPYRHPIQQQPPQLPPHAHLLHQQPPSFPPHMAPPPLMHSPFLGPYDSPPPPPAAPPADPELHKRIDKLVEYIAKNGPEFEAMIREKQQDNPEYSFLIGGDGHAYYQYRLWASTRPPGAHFPPFPPMMHPPPNPLMNPSLPLNAPRASSGSMLGLPQIHQPPFGSFYDPHAHPSFSRPDYDQSTKAFKGLSGPLPSDVAAELSNVLNNLSGTKDSIKGAKIWFMQRSPFAPALAEALRERVFSLDDSERQLHIIFLANDILFESLHRRVNTNELDNEALAFKPVLGSMLARIFHNPQNREENQSRLQKILQFWASKEVYDQDTIHAFENEMVSGVSSNAFSGSSIEVSSASTDSASVLSQEASNQNIPLWQQHERLGSAAVLTDKDRPDHPASFPGVTPPLSTPQFLPNAVVPGPPFTASGPIPSSAQPANQPPVLPPSLGEKVPPYPMFPPGLIPGMVRKMQIGSGVPYSPLSPLDIPNTIPPSNVPQSEILERVSKFFKEIGEVNPSEGPMRSSGSRDDDDADDYEYDREPPLPRKGGARIPPPPNLHVDPETGAHADGSVEGKGSGSGRLGLGATANPNEVTQYDDVYTSYRKQRSTSYHTSMSARAATR
ncbi:hypothetical protein CDL15_Pgr012568 [Punica granatum]|uniref:Calcium homeostasis endoplasmic reticulum protein n=1 Tax=Punica granatum TaxID=22663 RepID=A0A218XZG6_PUNGR|nr:hypothetical protein CDL15_Pgr012568 [Punica granatum]